MMYTIMGWSGEGEGQGKGRAKSLCTRCTPRQVRADFSEGPGPACLTGCPLGEGELRFVLPLSGAPHVKLRALPRRCSRSKGDGAPAGRALPGALPRAAGSAPRFRARATGSRAPVRSAHGISGRRASADAGSTLAQVADLSRLPRDER